MSFKWDVKSALLLVKRFHETEALWNRHHPDYKNRVKRAALMRGIAREFGTERSEVERKLKNLSSHYYREKKFYARKKATIGSYASEPRWFAYKALNFLQDKCVPCIRHLEKSKVKEENQVSYSAAGTSSDDDSESVPTSGNTQERQWSRPRVTDRIRDEAAVFGEYIALKIRRMKPIIAATVQHRIQNIIYEVDVDAYTAATSATKVSTSNGAGDGNADGDTVEVPKPIKRECECRGDESDTDPLVS